ncbi:hypothetical protein [Mucilaginibacter antarcticus]
MVRYRNLAYDPDLKDEDIVTYYDFVRGLVAQQKEATDLVLKTPPLGAFL